MAIAPLAILLIALPILLAVLAIVLIATRRPSTSSGGRPLTLVVTRFVALGYAALALIATLITVAVTLVSDTVGVTIPVRQFWPDVHSWITIEQGPDAAVVDGGFAMADVTVSGLGMDARLLLASGHALQGLASVVIAVVVALLCHRLLGGQPFRSTLTRSVSLTAVTIAAGGLLWQVCLGIGGSIAASQALTVRSWQNHHPLAQDPDSDPSFFDTRATGLPEPTFALTIDFWPLFLGLALAAVAAAFKYGERLQRDTEGLI